MVAYAPIKLSSPKTVITNSAFSMIGYYINSICTALDLDIKNVVLPNYDEKLAKCPMEINCDSFIENHKLNDSDKYNEVADLALNYHRS
ncbi:MAG: hypothetical protein MHPSP_004093, partial [Paramarteilia canceri]